MNNFQSCSTPSGLIFRFIFGAPGSNRQSLPVFAADAQPFGFLSSGISFLLGDSGVLSAEVTTIDRYRFRVKRAWTFESETSVVNGLLDKV